MYNFTPKNEPPKPNGGNTPSHPQALSPIQPGGYTPMSNIQFPSFPRFGGSQPGFATMQPPGLGGTPLQLGTFSSMPIPSFPRFGGSQTGFATMQSPGSGLNRLPSPEDIIRAVENASDIEDQSLKNILINPSVDLTLAFAKMNFPQKVKLLSFGAVHTPQHPRLALLQNSLPYNLQQCVTNMPPDDLCTLICVMLNDTTSRLALEKIIRILFSNNNFVSAFSKMLFHQKVKLLSFGAALNPQDSLSYNLRQCVKNMPQDELSPLLCAMLDDRSSPSSTPILKTIIEYNDPGNVFTGSWLYSLALPYQSKLLSFWITQDPSNQKLTWFFTSKSSYELSTLILYALDNSLILPNTEQYKKLTDTLHAKESKEIQNKKQNDQRNYLYQQLIVERDASFPPSSVFDAAILDTRPLLSFTNLTSMHYSPASTQHLDCWTTQGLGAYLEYLLKNDHENLQIPQIETLLRERIKKFITQNTQNPNRTLTQSQINSLKLDVILVRELTQALDTLRTVNSDGRYNDLITQYEEKQKLATTNIQKALGLFSSNIPVDFLTIHRLDELLEEGILKPLAGGIPESIRQRYFPELLSLWELNSLLNKVLTGQETGIKKELLLESLQTRLNGGERLWDEDGSESLSDEVLKAYITAETPVLEREPLPDGCELFDVTQKVPEEMIELFPDDMKEIIHDMNNLIERYHTSKESPQQLEEFTNKYNAMYDAIIEKSENIRTKIVGQFWEFRHTLENKLVDENLMEKLPESNEVEAAFQFLNRQYDSEKTPLTDHELDEDVATFLNSFSFQKNFAGKYYEAMWKFDASEVLLGISLTKPSLPQQIEEIRKKIGSEDANKLIREAGKILFKERVLRQDRSSIVCDLSGIIETLLRAHQNYLHHKSCLENAEKSYQGSTPWESLENWENWATFKEAFPALSMSDKDFESKANTYLYRLQNTFCPLLYDL